MVAEGIVDVLEFIEIKKQQRALIARARRFRQEFFHLLVQTVAIVQAGQGIALGQVNQLLRGLLFLRDIFEHPQMADKRALAIVNRMAQAGDQTAIGQTYLRDWALVVPHGFAHPFRKLIGRG